MNSFLEPASQRTEQEELALGEILLETTSADWLRWGGASHPDFKGIMSVKAEREPVLVSNNLG